MWSVDPNVPINVYDSNGVPVCQCQTALYAKTIVEAVNALDGQTGESIKDTERLDYLETLHKVGLWGQPGDLLGSSGSRERIDRDMQDPEVQADIAARAAKEPSCDV